MPRKTGSRGASCGGPRHASMRPRPDAAENLDAAREAYARAAASMRPRPDAAENKWCLDAGIKPDAPASMRPRPDAAENFMQEKLNKLAGFASMRPRPDAAENSFARSNADTALEASMRPRPDAAENL